MNMIQGSAFKTGISFHEPYVSVRNKLGIGNKVEHLSSKLKSSSSTKSSEEATSTHLQLDTSAIASVPVNEN